MNNIYLGRYKWLDKYPTNKLIQKVQEKVNEYIRFRDANKFCISCGRKGVTDAGHFISISQCQKLRFDFRNIHGQCAYCNRFLEGNTLEYEEHLIEKIGEDEVKNLKFLYKYYKRDNSKWDRTELIIKYKEAQDAINELKS